MRRKRNRITTSQPVQVSRRAYVMWIAITLLFVSTIYITIQTATSGAELAELESKRSELSRANQRLSSRLIKMSSLTEIEAMAERDGYINAVDTVYLSDPDSFASLQ